MRAKSCGSCHGFREAISNSLCLQGVFSNQMSFLQGFAIVLQGFAFLQPTSLRSIMMHFDPSQRILFPLKD